MTSMPFVALLPGFNQFIPEHFFRGGPLALPNPVDYWTQDVQQDLHLKGSFLKDGQEEV